MGTDNYDLAAELFLQARELEPVRRERFLDEACRGDDRLRAEVESLLEYDQSTMGTGAVESADDLARPASKIGDYRILRKIGEGGMGEVYLAEQGEPRRWVALKIIKWGMDTREVVARFESERQALALMDHPNIARVFDAGTTKQGRPYFVMEHIKGVPITEHCDRHQLTIKARLALFEQVCEGVQHAHQKAIIHRDIKPSNVLVAIQDDRAVPKIIDFGVAKAMAQQLTERRFSTEAGQLIGTREYMSPEQAELTAQDVDTRTDVYSLGVLLYELLVGALPFASRERPHAGRDGIHHKPREEPSKPSIQIGALGAVAATAARNRGTDPRSLARQLRGDLDGIALKALAKDRTRRYGSPNELAADIRRHLGHEPVLARLPGATYRAWKFVRRHTAGVVLTAATFLLLVGFAARERIQGERIARERDRANQVSLFQRDMLTELDPESFGRAMLDALRERAAEAQRRRGANEAAVEETLASFEKAMLGVNPTDVALKLIDEDILDRAGKAIEERFRDEPLIAARLRHTMGRTYQRLGLLHQAEPHARLAVEIRRRELGPDHRDTHSSMNNLAILFMSLERYDDAESLYLDVLRTRRGARGDDVKLMLAVMNNLAILYDKQRRYDEAEPLYVEVLETQQRAFPDDQPAKLRTQHNLAMLYVSQLRYDEAESLFLRTIESRERVLVEDHPETLTSKSCLGRVYAKQGRFGEAEPLLLETLAVQRRVLGDDHPQTGDTLYRLACLAALRGDRTRALEWLHQSVEAGWTDADWIVQDPDLDLLRGDSGFAAIVTAMNKSGGRN